MLSTNQSSNRSQNFLSPRNFISPRSYKYAINRSQHAVGYALSTIKDFSNNQQVKQALDLVHNTQERIKLVEKMVQQKNIQKDREEMERINKVRPLLDKVTERFHTLVNLTKQKTYGVDTRDFEKFGMRTMQTKMNFHLLVQLSKITQEEKLDFNEELDEEYCHYRRKARANSLLKLDQVGTRNLTQRSVNDNNFQYFMKKKETEPPQSLNIIAENVQPQSPKIIKSLTTPIFSPPKVYSPQPQTKTFSQFAKLHAKSKRLKMIQVDSQLTYLTKESEQSLKLITLPQIIQPQLSKPTIKRRVLNPANTTSKVASHRPKDNQTSVQILSLHRKKLQPSALYGFISSQHIDEDEDNELKF